MSSNFARPKWWQLYLTLPLLIALFAVDNRLKLSSRGHQAVQIGIVLVVYGLVHLWLKANARTLSKMDQRRFRGKVTLIRMPLNQLSYTQSDKRPMFQLPDLEIKGTLSDTFEIDYIDAEFFSVDEVAQEVNKE